MKIKRFKKIAKVDFSKYVKVFEADQIADDPEALALDIKPTFSKEEIKDLILTMTDDLGGNDKNITMRVFLFNQTTSSNLEITNKNSLNLIGSNVERVAKWFEDNKGFSLQYQVTYSNGGYYDQSQLKIFYGREAPAYLQGYIKDTDALADAFKSFSSIKKKFKMKNVDIDVYFQSQQIKFIILDPNIESEKDFGIMDDTKEVRAFCDKINTEIFRGSTRYSNYMTGYTYDSKEVYIAYQGNRKVSSTFKTQMLTWLYNQLITKMPEYSFDIVDLTTLVTNANNAGYDRWSMNAALRNNETYKEVANKSNISNRLILGKINYGPAVAGKKAIKKRAVRKKAAKKATNLE
jgi:hypothetical protein